MLQKVRVFPSLPRIDSASQTQYPAVQHRHFTGFLTHSRNYVLKDLVAFSRGSTPEAMGGVGHRRGEIHSNRLNRKWNLDMFFDREERSGGLAYFDGYRHKANIGNRFQALSDTSGAITTRILPVMLACFSRSIELLLTSIRGCLSPALGPQFPGCKPSALSI